MSIHDKIGKNIIHLRKGRGLTQEGFALECGISSSYLRLMEHGKANPTVKELMRVAAILNVEIEALLSDPEQNRRSAAPLGESTAPARSVGP